jgi:deoxyribodipyrimidine photo-lyase
MRGLMWFREDLRTIDNTALHQAAAQCEDGIVAIFLLDTNMWKQHEVAACRVNFMLQGLVLLTENLAKLHIPLFVINIDDATQIPEILLQHLTTCKAQALFFNHQYELNERKRDAAVTTYLTKHDIKIFAFDDQVILAPGTIKNLQGHDYKVFTAYKQAWQKKFREQHIKLLTAPKAQAPISLSVKATALPEKLIGFTSHVNPKLWPAGEKAASSRLRKFIENNLFEYHETRDFPAMDGTSKLSPYLAAGMISPRQCFLAALDANHNEIDSGNKGASTWLGELIWREFYKHILLTAPRVSMHKAYQEKTDKLRWDYNEDLFRSWQTGQTGYPIIDAAMRQLNTIGWMHNRLRMIVAMFLSKNLFYDWRLGEKYFISHLIDGDLAANNGGWQWSASTGTDAAPYFRIFNPVRQSERFDEEGKFILQYCPELKGFDKRTIHNPYAKLPEQAAKQGYPRPIIDLRANRERVIAAYRKVSHSTSS